MREFEVRDDGRMISFEGVELSRVSSHREGKARWIEMVLYRTRAGSYVLAAVGRSVVNGEVDRHWVQVSEEPQGIIERLHMYDDDGARYIPRTSRELLTAAAQCDAHFAQVYERERIA